jgi:hypothetical protein
MRLAGKRFGPDAGQCVRRSSPRAHPAGAVHDLASIREYLCEAVFQSAACAELASREGACRGPPFLEQAPHQTQEEAFLEVFEGDTGQLV